MTSSEFHSWWTDLTTRWPSISAWLAKCFPEDLRQRDLLRTWRDVLASASLADCLEINKQMQAGDLAWVGEYDADKERLPQHVRRLVRQIAWERDGRIEPAEHYPLGPDGSGFPAAKILRRWRELEGEGATRAEARERSLAEFPLGRPMREPRFMCLTCLDDGRVLVASNTAIQMMLAGTLDACRHRVGVMRCTCGAGQRLVRKSAGREIPWATYHPDLDFAIRDTLWGEDERRRFATWVDTQAERRAEDLAKAASNYEPSFAAFNQRES